MKNKLLLLLLSLSITASAQSWEFNIGTNLNNFYGIGYNLNVGFDYVDKNNLEFYLTFGLKKYSGDIRASGGGLGGGYVVEGQFDKTVLQLSWYFSLLIDEHTEGRYKSWGFISQESNPPTFQEIDSELNEWYPSYHSKFYGGINARLAYEIPLSRNFYLVPQYICYAGFANEFIEFPEITKSINNMLGIGIKRKL